MTTEDYVSFETAKLLKERGFDGECRDYYSTDGHFYSEDFKSDWNHGGEAIVIFSAPTLQMVMKWLREVYGLFIRITEDITGNVFEWSVYQKNYGCKASTYVEDSYEQACETAIKYCLENLI